MDYVEVVCFEFHRHDFERLAVDVVAQEEKPVIGLPEPRGYKESEAGVFDDIPCSPPTDSVSRG